jgi:hypothetical protein
MSWDSSADARGSTSTISYQIQEINSSSSSPIIFTTTSAQREQRIYEIGRPYEISIQAIDRDGLASAVATSSVAVPSFLKAAYFYKDPNPTSTLYLIDLYYDSYPFIPALSDSSQPYKLVAFYLDEDDVVDPIIFDKDSASQITSGSLPGAAVVRYTPCCNLNSQARFDDLTSAIVLPNAECPPFAPTIRYLNPSQLEDSGHLQLALVSSTQDVVFSASSDYLTIAFYDLDRLGLFTRIFSLVAVDKTRY